MLNINDPCTPEMEHLLASRAATLGSLWLAPRGASHPPLHIDQALGAGACIRPLVAQNRAPSHQTVTKRCHAGLAGAEAQGLHHIRPCTPLSFSVLQPAPELGSMQKLWGLELNHILI